MKKIKDEWICNNPSCINYKKTPENPKSVGDEPVCPNPECNIPLTNLALIINIKKKKLRKKVLIFSGVFLALIVIGFVIIVSIQSYDRKKKEAIAKIEADSEAALKKIQQNSQIEIAKIRHKNKKDSLARIVHGFGIVNNTNNLGNSLPPKIQGINISHTIHTNEFYWPLIPNATSFTITIKRSDKSATSDSNISIIDKSISPQTENGNQKFTFTGHVSGSQSTKLYDVYIKAYDANHNKIASGKLKRIQLICQ